MPEFPKNVHDEDHKEKMENYVGLILSNKGMREHPEVMRIFKLQHFFEQAEKEKDNYEVVMT